MACTGLRPGRQILLHAGDGLVAVCRGSNLAKLFDLGGS